MAENRKNNNKKNTGFAFAVWLLVALILLVLFFVERETIVTNLKNSDFFGRVFGRTPEFIERHETAESDEGGALQIDVLPTEQSAPPDGITRTGGAAERTAESAIAAAAAAESQSEAASETQSAAERSDALPASENENAQIASASVRAAETAASVPATTNVQLCFITVSPSDGSVSRKIVTRELPKSDSPLTDAINALIAGPSSGENSDGSVRSLIPDGTRLLGASVSNGIATLNFNEAFTFNAYGVEGYRAALEQVVYTATSFNTVNSVQFIIEGRREDYLGSEGIRIGLPLAQSSFN